MKKKYSRIGIFDSGLGGTTVLKELSRILPNEDYIYYGDSKNAPYGIGKSKEELQLLCKKIVDFLISNECKAIVVACNTATIATLDYLKKIFSIPIIGIIDSGAKLGVENTKNKKISVFSTEFTAKSNAYKNAILAIDETIKVSQIPCIEFASMIEKGWKTFKNNDEIVLKYIKKIPPETDTLILGCTHYPIIRNEIKKYIPEITIVDPAVKLAEDLKETLENLNILNDKKEKGEVVFFITGELDKFKPTAEKFLETDIQIYKLS